MSPVTIELVTIPKLTGINTPTLEVILFKTPRVILDFSRTNFIVNNRNLLGLVLANFYDVAVVIPNF
jgi:hypothetical protein